MSQQNLAGQLKKNLTLSYLKERGNPVNSIAAPKTFFSYKKKVKACTTFEFLVIQCGQKRNKENSKKKLRLITLS